MVISISSLRAFYGFVFYSLLLGSDMDLSNCFAAVPADYAQSSRTDPNLVGFLSHYSEIALILTHWQTNTMETGVPSTRPPNRWMTPARHLSITRRGGELVLNIYEYSVLSKRFFHCFCVLGVWITQLLNSSLTESLLDIVLYIYKWKNAILILADFKTWRFSSTCKNDYNLVPFTS